MGSAEAAAVGKRMRKEGRTIMKSVNLWGFEIRYVINLPEGEKRRFYVDFMEETHVFDRYSDAVQFIQDLLGWD